LFCFSIQLFLANCFPRYHSLKKILERERVYLKAFFLFVWIWDLASTSHLCFNLELTVGEEAKNSSFLSSLLNLLIFIKRNKNHHLEMLLPLISAVIKSSMGWVFWGGLIFLDIDRSRREVAGS